MKRSMILLLLMIGIVLIEAGGQRGNADKPSGKAACRYRKGPWTQCDTGTKTRNRALTLKAGDKSVCEATKTITKDCNKACRYEKGTWGTCDPAQSQMVRMDRLKPASDPGCAATREVSRNCNPDGGGQRQRNKNKGDKDRSGARRNKNNRNNQQ